jgi:putative membrane protein
MRTTLINLGLCAGLLWSGSAALADRSPAPATQQANSDQEFLDKALGVNQLELQLGQLAAQKGTTAEVKAMGKKMVEKHTELGNQLADLARHAGGSGKAALSSDQRATYDRVAAQSGSALDAAFKDVVDAGHIKELAMYRDEVGRAKSPALRELAQRRVAKLEETVAQSKAAKPSAEPKQDW